MIHLSGKEKNSEITLPNLSFSFHLPPSQPFRQLTEEKVDYEAFSPWGLSAVVPACLTTVGQGH